MLTQVILAVIGLAGGMTAAGGMVALQIGLGITPRFAGVTHTADSILTYEDAAMLGAITGCVVQLYDFNIPFGIWGLGIFGVFAGIYLGGWILALAEMVDIFPIIIRRLKLQSGIPVLIILVAIAKILGSMYYFYKGWHL